MDRGALWATVHGVVKSWTQLSDTFTFIQTMYQELLFSQEDNYSNSFFFFFQILNLPREMACLI